jgi:hypothetical protein
MSALMIGRERGQCGRGAKWLDLAKGRILGVLPSGPCGGTAFTNQPTSDGKQWKKVNVY